MVAMQDPDIRLADINSSTRYRDKSLENFKEGQVVRIYNEGRIVGKGTIQWEVRKPICPKKVPMEPILRL